MDRVIMRLLKLGVVVAMCFLAGCGVRSKRAVWTVVVEDRECSEWSLELTKSMVEFLEGRSFYLSDRGRIFPLTDDDTRGHLQDESIEPHKFTFSPSDAPVDGAGKVIVRLHKSVAGGELTVELFVYRYDSERGWSRRDTSEKHRLERKVPVQHIQSRISDLIVVTSFKR